MSGSEGEVLADILALTMGLLFVLQAFLKARLRSDPLLEDRF